MEISKQVDKTATNGEIHLENESSDTSILERLGALGSLHVFIIQRKAQVNYFSSNVSYEIMDARKNALFKASKPKSILPSTKKPCKISVKNLRNVKVLSIVVEPTVSFNAIGTEASVYLYPKKKIAHVAKYEGTVGPPCFEIFNVDIQTAFTIDNSMKKTSSPHPIMLEYDVSTKQGTVGTIMMKTGLNFVLTTDPRMPNIEKATLIGVILAMDLLKTGSRDANKEPLSNQYLFT